MNLLQISISVITTLGILAVAYYIRMLLHRRILAKEAQTLFQQGSTFAQEADAILVPFKLKDATTLEPTSQAFAGKNELRASAHRSWENALTIAFKAHAYFLAARLANNLGYLALLIEDAVEANTKFTVAKTLLLKVRNNSAKEQLALKVESNLEAAALWRLLLNARRQVHLDHMQALSRERSGAAVTASSYEASSSTVSGILVRAVELKNSMLTGCALHETARVHAYLKQFEQAEILVQQNLVNCEAQGLDPASDLHLLDQIREEDTLDLMRAIHDECFRENETRNAEIIRSCTGLMVHADRLGVNGDNGKAVEQARKALKLSEPLGPLHRTVAEALQTLGRALLGFGEIVEARQVLLRARFVAEEHPTDTELHARITRALAYCADA